jgi:hypothetical protein
MQSASCIFVENWLSRVNVARKPHPGLDVTVSSRLSGVLALYYLAACSGFGLSTQSTLMISYCPSNLAFAGNQSSPSPRS